VFVALPDYYFHLDPGDQPRPDRAGGRLLSAPAVAVGLASRRAAAVASSQSNCWLGADPASLSLTQRRSSRRLPRVVPAPTRPRLSDPGRPPGRLGRLIAVIIGLFIIGSLLTGLMFFTMSWMVKRCCARCGVDVFQAPAPPVAQLLRRTRGRRPDEPHHQRLGDINRR